MKQKVLSMVLAGMTFFGSLAYSQNTNARAENFPNKDLVPYDKQLHFICGAGIGTGAYLFCPWLEKFFTDKSRIPGFIWSLGMSGLAGAGKEIVYDKYMGRGTPEFGDFAFTLGGGLVSGVTLNIFENVLNLKNNSLKAINFGFNPKNKEFGVLYTGKY